jgi:hypothetical protein
MGVAEKECSYREGGEFDRIFELESGEHVAGIYRSGDFDWLSFLGWTGHALIYRIVGFYLWIAPIDRIYVSGLAPRR